MKQKGVFISIGIIVVLTVAWWLGSPLFIDNVVDEPLPLELIQDDMVVTQPIEEEDLPTAPTQEIIQEDDEIQETSQPAPDNPFPKVLESHAGMFIDADSRHKGEGEVAVIENTLRFEEFSVTNGPDLRVYLATDSSSNDFIDLGELKGNKGNQNYEIPVGTDLKVYDTVVIWCRAFSVLFSSAELVALT